MTPEAAISHFLELGRRLQASPPVVGREVLEKILAWYQDCRIDGAVLEDDGDMLLLQAGATQLMLLDEPSDTRGWPDSRRSYTQQRHRYIDITRQVFASGGNSEVEFDDAAVQMSFTLAFDLADGTEASSTVWIGSPSVIESGVIKFTSPYVESLIDRPAEIIAVSAFNCG
jgi:hypothetical protein